MIQHAQQLVAELYDYTTPNWSTAASSYARRYLEHVTEGKPAPPERPPAGAGGFLLSAAERERLRVRVDRALAKDPCPVTTRRIA